jgi:SAM-dependent methyltransferase
MNGLERPACVCGADVIAGAPIEAKDAESGGLFSYVRCAQCGTFRLCPRPKLQDIGKYYPANYEPHSVRPDSPATSFKRLIYRVFWQDPDKVGALRGPIRKLLRVLLYPLRGRTVLAFYPTPLRRVFEFGASSGNDLEVFREAGWEVGGCELSKSACAVAASRGIQLQNCPAENAVIEEASVSCVLMNNVLEHLHDPVAVLKTSQAALGPGGTLVLFLPNHASWSARLFAAAWPGFDAPRHLWGFTPASINALLDRLGFMVDQIYHQAPGRWAWESCLDARHSAKPVSAWRAKHARKLAPFLLPFGVVSAFCARGDFMHIVAHKRG